MSIDDVILFYFESLTLLLYFFPNSKKEKQLLYSKLENLNKVKNLTIFRLMSHERLVVDVY